jgi:GntR family transcriptional regulator
MPRSAPLALTVSPGDARSIADQIVDAIRRKISAGELEVGEKLPSLRGLAQQLAINPNTVSKAYAKLIEGGWVQAQVGLGLFVAAQRDHLSARERGRRLDAAVDRFVSEVVAIRCNPEDAAQRVTDALDGLVSRQSA